MKLQLSFDCVCTIFVFTLTSFSTLFCSVSHTVSLCVALGFVCYFSGLCVHIFEIVDVAMGRNCLRWIHVADGRAKHGQKLENIFNEMVWRRSSVVSVDAFPHDKPNFEIWLKSIYFLLLKTAEKMRAPVSILTRWSMIRLHISFCHWYRLHGNLCLEFFALIVSIGLQFVKWHAFERNTSSRWCGKTLAGMMWPLAEPIFQFESPSKLTSSMFEQRNAIFRRRYEQRTKWTLFFPFAETSKRSKLVSPKMWAIFWIWCFRLWFVWWFHSFMAGNWHSSWFHICRWCSPPISSSEKWVSNR